MKKILFVSESLNVGGMEKVLVTLANALAEHGFDVTIVTYHKTGEDGLLGELDSRVHFIYKARKEFPLMLKYRHTRKYFKGDKYEERQSARRLWNYFVGRNKKFDAEIAFYRGPSVKIVSGSPNKNAVKIAWAHTDYKLCDHRTITKFFSSEEDMREAYKCFDRIVCVSDKACESFADVIGYKEKLTTVYNMIDLAEIDRKCSEDCPLPKRKFTVATVGRLIEDKGYDRLLKAVKKLNDEGADFDLRIVGYGRCEEKLKAYAAENGLDNVFFAGKQLNPYKYIKDADMFICTSLREGFSIVCAEALACGLPVVSTDCTGPTEILDNGKYGILIPNSEEAICEKLKEIISAPEQLDKFRSVARARAEYFGKTRITDQIINHILQKENRK